LLQRHFIEYRLEPFHSVDGAPDVIEPVPGQIIYLGESIIAPETGSDEARFHGRIPVQRALCARSEYSVPVASIAGILLSGEFDGSDRHYFFR
jgi:hypothetical protein